MNGYILLRLHLWLFKNTVFFYVILVALVLMCLLNMPHRNLDESCGQLYLVLDSLAFHSTSFSAGTVSIWMRIKMVWQSKIFIQDLMI